MVKMYLLTKKNSHDANLKLNETASALREMRNKNGLRGPRPEPSGTDGEYQDSCFRTLSVKEREGGGM